MNSFLLNAQSEGKGKPLVFLHGLTGSRRYWNKLKPFLSRDHRQIALDLLGFGLSPKPNTISYTLEDHVKAIDETLKSLSVKEPVTLVGHSIGALIVLGFAAAHPKKANGLILINPPIFTSPEEASHYLLHDSFSSRFIVDGPISFILCNVFCRFLGPITRSIAPFFLPNYPREVARDAFLHTWYSYSQTLLHVVKKQNITELLPLIKQPITVVVGTKDRKAAPQNVELFKRYAPQTQIVSLDGGHNLPLEHPRSIAQIIDTH